MRVLIAGGEGQLGRELARAPWPDGVVVEAPSEAEFDITDPSAVKAVVADRRPTVIINAAAYTAVDQAEKEPGVAERVNATAVGHLAAAADEAGSALIHFSTDYVFDGTAEGWYAESDPPRPAGVYGLTKLVGEKVALGAGCGLVLRTSWVYGALGGNFVRTMRRLARERDRLAVVHDQRGCPTATADLAATVLGILERDPRPSGLLHAAAPDDASWWELAVATINMLDPAREVAVDQLSTDEYPTAAQRPLNSRLSCERLRERYGIRLRPWREALSEVSMELNAQESGGE